MRWWDLIFSLYIFIFGAGTGCKDCSPDATCLSLLELLISCSSYQDHKVDAYSWHWHFVNNRRPMSLLATFWPFQASQALSRHYHRSFYYSTTSSSPLNQSGGYVTCRRRRRRASHKGVPGLGKPWKTSEVDFRSRLGWEINFWRFRGGRIKFEWDVQGLGYQEWVTIYVSPKAVQNCLKKKKRRCALVQ